MYLWNQHWIKHYRDDTFDRQSWKEIGDPAVLAHKDKHYIVGPEERGGSLPLNLAQAGDTVELNVEIADDLATNTQAHTTLRLMIEQLTTLDPLELRLNGTALDLASATKRLNYNDCWLDLDVSKLIRQGSNALTIQCIGRNPHVLAPLTLRRVEVLVSGLGK